MKAIEKVLRVAGSVLCGGMTVLLLMISSVPAYAVDTSVAYKSGTLVLLFLGVLALIVVAQLVPALILMVGFFKGALASLTRKKAPAVETSR